MNAHVPEATVVNGQFFSIIDQSLNYAYIANVPIIDKIGGLDLIRLRMSQVSAAENPEQSPMSASPIHRVLFVCLGNICRSPAAEGIFLDLIQKRGWQDQFHVDSAGTIGYHSGAAADRRMRAAALNRGIELTSRARQVTPADLDQFDWVIAMDQQNLTDLQSLHSRPRAELRLLGSFLETNSSWPRDVPDPYYGGPEGFDFVLDMLAAVCPRLLDTIVNRPPRGI